MYPVLVIVGGLLLVALGAIWLTRHRSPDVDDARLARSAAVDAELTRLAGYSCAHLPIDNPRTSAAHRRV